MTDGTDASRRITGIATLRSRAGASSTMKIEESTAITSPSTTAIARRQQRAVDERPGAQVVGRGGRVARSWPASFAICVSRLPPGPSQLRPLCSKIGHARIATNTTIATTTTRDQQRHRAERTLGAAVGPWVAQALEHGALGSA